ncbi:MAG: DUF4381 domain-containing protein [Halioglobus sp.]|nr:DUF4381 domain-containing protein [Halioglobus sp.]
MSAPPLPEVFGNYALQDFAEVVSPAAVSWLPQTAGWLWLAALLLALALHYGWRRARQWYRDRYRREAAARLQQLARDGAQDNWLVELNKLLKLTALAGFSRDRVARLSGRDWVDFLNRHCASAPFSEEQGELLARGVYTGVDIGDNQRQALYAACLVWVQRHEGPADV